MKKAIYLLLLFSFLAAEEVSFSVDAREMEYDSQIEKLTAKDVTITFRDGSKLIGRDAFLRFDEQTGAMESAEREDPVVFTGLMSKEGESPRHIMVKSREMKVEVLQEKDLLVTATGQVQIFIDDEYVAYGSRATFQNNGGNSTSGIVTLEGDKARIEKINGDVVLANKLLFNPFENKLQGWKVEADLASGNIHLKATRLEWFPKTGFLSFEDSVEVSRRGLGSLSSKEKLQIQQGAKGEIEMLFASGSVIASSEQRGVSLGSFGELHVDNIGQKMVVKSPMDAEGEPIFATQAYFEDKAGRIYADLFEIRYKNVGSDVVAESVDVTGHVRMQSHMLPHSKLEHYAIADRVQFNPETGEMKLAASKGKRVLYLDKGEGVEVSAPAITIMRGVDKEVEFHGKGNVRLTFTPEDLDQMKKYFPSLN